MKSSDKIATCTVTSVAYKPVLHTLTINAGFEIAHGITKQQQLTENRDSKVDMEQNMAYGSSADHDDAQMPLTSNVAYCISGKPLNVNMEENVAYGSSTDAQISLTSNIAYCKPVRKQLEESCDYENEYDYI